LHHQTGCGLVLADVDLDAALFEFAMSAPRCLGSQQSTLRSPPVMAPAMRKVPASMRSGFDAMARAVEFGDALDADGAGAGAFDFCSHGGEEGGEVCDLGLAGAVFEDRFAFGESGGHEEIFGAGDGDLVEDDVRAFEAAFAVVGAAGFEVAVVLGDGGAHGFEAEDVEVDGRPPMAHLRAWRRGRCRCGR